MDGMKSFLTSKTVWGGLLAVASALIGLFGYTMTAADTAEAMGAVTSITAGIGGVIAVYGRVVATKRIGS